MNKLLKTNLFLTIGIFYLGGIFSLGIIICSPSLGQAEEKTEESQSAEKEAEPKKEEKVLKGVIASFGKAAKTAAVNVDTTGEITGGESNPISASISKSGDGCKAVVTNTSAENAFSLRYQIIGKTKRGQRVFSRSYGTRLKPGQSKETVVNCQKDWNMSVVLKSGKQL